MKKLALHVLLVSSLIITSILGSFSSVYAGDTAGEFILNPET
jgi:hypothetical protein